MVEGRTKKKAKITCKQNTLLHCALIVL